VEKYTSVPDEWDEKKALGPPAPYRERGFLRDWLLDSTSRDQICVFNKETVSISWNNKNNPPEVLHEREGWTEGYISWSVRGSYLASVHRQGIALWGGREMERLNRYHHPGVRFLDFSPNETYLVTFSPDALPAPTPEKPWGPESIGHHVIVWSVRTGRILRTFPLSTEEIASKNIPWPLFKWSWDEKYFGRIVSNSKITVYETPEMGLVDKKSIPLPGVTEFEWMPYFPEDDSEKVQGTGKKGSQNAAPKRNLTPPHVIAYFVPQHGADQPAQLALMTIPNRQVIRSKQVFFGNSAKIHFQPQGDFLLFKVDRTSRTGKTSFVSLEVFRLREKDFPADSMEVKEVITAFGWEPNNNRFALVTTSDTPTPDLDIKTVLAGAPGKMTGSIYEVEAAVEKKGSASVPGGVRLLKVFERKSVNSIYWCPKGRFIVFAGLRNLQGILEFYDVEANSGDAPKEMTTTTSINGKTITSTKEVDSVQLLGATEHHGATDVAWDPTGRYVMTSVSMWAKGMDNGFMLWDIKGTMLNKQSRDQLKQALWRPRPASLVPKSKQKSIRKNFKSYAREFEVQDATESSALSAQDIAERKRLFDEWIMFRSHALLSIDAEQESVAVMES
jgi:translation initiation factor 3 subunit B